MRPFIYVNCTTGISILHICFPLGVPRMSSRFSLKNTIYALGAVRRIFTSAP